MGKKKQKNNASFTNPKNSMAKNPQKAPTWAELDPAQPLLVSIFPSCPLFPVWKTKENTMYLCQAKFQFQLS